MSDSVWLHGLQHTRLFCPSRRLLRLMPLSQWCHPNISFSVTSFSFCPQSFTESGSFPMNQLFASGGASAIASVIPVNIQGGFPLGWTGLISLQFKELSRVFSSTTVQKHQVFGAQPSFTVQLSHPYMTTGKTIHSFDYMDLCWQNDVSAF